VFDITLLHGARGSFAVAAAFVATVASAIASAVATIGAACCASIPGAIRSTVGVSVSSTVGVTMCSSVAAAASEACGAADPDRRRLQLLECFELHERRAGCADLRVWCTQLGHSGLHVLLRAWGH
jgi:hypothetical protein